MIDQYKLNVVQGQALNLLQAEDKTFLSRYKKSEDSAIQEWKDLQIAIHLNGLKANIIKDIAEHPLLSRQIDARLKMQSQKE